MKQLLFCSRFSLDSSATLASAAQSPDAPTLLGKVKAARIRHSACGVSSILVRQGDRLLGVLEGGDPYVDRMWAALAKDGLLEELKILAEKPVHDREYSEVALSLVEVDTLEPRPAWADKNLMELDTRAARRILGNLRAFHGLHAEPARESHLHSVSVGPVRV